MEANHITLLRQALLDKAAMLGKLEEMRAAQIKFLKTCPNDQELEKAMVCCWADGILYGNWPWVKV